MCNCFAYDNTHYYKFDRRPTVVVVDEFPKRMMDTLNADVKAVMDYRFEFNLS